MKKILAPKLKKVKKKLFTFLSFMKHHRTSYYIKPFYYITVNSFNFKILRFHFYSFQKKLAKFMTLLNFRNFGLIIRK